MEKPAKIKVSEDQVQCLEVAARDVQYLMDSLQRAQSRLKTQRRKSGFPTTGSEVIYNTTKVDLGELVKILSKMAVTLRESGQMDLIGVIENWYGKRRLLNITYKFSKDPRDNITPDQGYGDHFGIHKAIAETLFNSEYPNGEQVRHYSSSHRYFESLRATGAVSLLYQPKELMYYI